MSLVLQSSGGGSVTLQEAVTASNLTITVPAVNGTMNTSGAVNEVPAGSASAPSIYPTGDTNTGIFFPSSDTIAFTEGGTEQMRLNSAGDLQMNSGYGSVATAYGCRAWVRFNGTGTVAINGSGNVSSITDNGTGDYTVNFTTAMPDANYAAAGFAQAGGGYAIRLSNVTQPTASAVRFSTVDPGVAVSDSAVVYLNVFR